jgi:glucosylceramidase
MGLMKRSHVLAGALCLGFSLSLGGCAASGPSDTGAAGTGGQSTAGTGGAGGQAGTGTGSGGDATAGAGGQVVTGVGGNAGTGVAGTGGSNPTGGSAGNGPAGGGGSATAGAAGNPGGRGGGTAGSSGGRGGQTAGRGGSGGSSAAGAGGAPAAEPRLITSAPGAYWRTTGTLTEVTTGTIDVTVNDASVQQNWDGMGGTFNEAGWNVLMMLSAADRDRAMRLLFDATDGARFQYGRIPIGASDYAVSRYTHNETANDTAMTNFSIARDNQYLIPYIRAALAIKPDLHLWASPWTPPSWMKDNNAIDGGRMRENATMFQALALYLARFVEEYKTIGITIEAIHPQNEPNYETRYPSCLWTAAGMTTFIASHLGPTFASRGLTAQIYLGTMSNNDPDKDGTIVTTVMANATAAGYVKGFGLQWNMVPIIAGLRSRNLPIVQTEHRCGNYHWNPMGFPPFNPDMPANDHAYAVESWGYFKDWIGAGVTMYSAWNMVLDTVGKNLDTMRPWPQNALLTVNTSTRTLNVTPAYHVFRHVSQYVDPGAKVVATTGGDALAFKNLDGTIVAVVRNAGAARNFIVSIAGRRQQFMMPADGWATINWK